MTPVLRRALTSAAAAVARSVGYTNAGTIEFLLDEDGRFYFLEMNTRLQVEHPITEMVTGIDLVRWQIRIARGERLDLDPDRLLTPSGHAIECRIYAEDPDNNFLPSPGRILRLRTPSGPGIRDDSGATAGLDVPIFYDPMISKLIAWAEDRPAAIARMRRALGEYVVAGIKTTLPFFTWLLAQPDFVAGRFHTTYLDEVLEARNGRAVRPAPKRAAEDVAAIAAVLQAVLSPASVAEWAGTPAAAASAGAGRRLESAREGRGAALTCSTKSKSMVAFVHVHVHRADGRFVVSVDGRESTIDVARIDAHTLSLLVGAASHEVTDCAPIHVTGQLAVGVGAGAAGGGAEWTAPLGPEGRRRASGRGPQRLVAPMPGKIVRILVKPGDPVRPRQPLVVIEAMKMENELRAARDGAVAELLVQEGHSVDVGALLLVVAPA